MVDLHTHILPGMDDGAESPEMSVAMLRAEWEDGVDTVALTPHFYRERESIERFLKRRDEAMQRLQAYIASQPEETQNSLPRLILGAEVAWMPNMWMWDGLERLCYEGTHMLMVELPTGPWKIRLMSDLCYLANQTGLMPMLAHFDRYFGLQKHKMLQEAASLGLPLQISADALLHFHTRHRALELLRQGGGYLISDCHNLTKRPPNIGKGEAVLQKHFDEDKVDAVLQQTEDLLTSKY